jgi:hypothetical protein
MNKICSKCKLLKSIEEFGKRSISKDGLFYKCKTCRNKEYLEKQETNIQYARNNYTNNKIAICLKQVEYYWGHREERLQYCYNNIEYKRKYDLQRLKENPEIYNANNAKRRSTKLNQTPKWVETKEIKLLYKKAKKLESSIGRKYHIDHIVPLNHNYVSGLHCLANLVPIPAKDNLHKGNRFWPDMPDYSQVIYDPITNTLIDKI